MSSDNSDDDDDNDDNDDNDDANDNDDDAEENGTFTKGSLESSESSGLLGFERVRVRVRVRASLSLTFLVSPFNLCHHCVHVLLSVRALLTLCQ